MYMDTIIISVIFIFILLLLFLKNKDIFILYSNTVLGKLLLISIILFFSKIHIGLGCLSIILILLYYKLNGYDYWSIHETELLDGIDCIYWINLKRSKDREKTMNKMFQDPIFFGKPIERIEAIDGKEDQVYDKLDIKTKKNTKLEYACLLSHLKAIKTFSDSTYETALIFEDDITLEFKRYWRRTIKSIIQNAPPDWEIIQLCYITSGTLIYDYTLNNYQKDHYGGIASMAAYVINHKAAKKLIKDTYDPLTEKYKLKDYHTHEADHYLYKCLRTYTYKYPYFIYPTENTSTLHPDDLSSHIRSKMKQEKMYLELYG